MRGVFVTGTDTATGKTFVARALAGALLRLGVGVGVMKPVASGCRRVRGRLESEDALQLARAAGLDPVPDDVCPLRYAAPLGPSVAARIERRRFRADLVVKAFARLRRSHDFMVVEGVGGLAVPLGGGSDVGDLAATMGLPLLVVAADRLGVLNHTMLTLGHAERRGLEVLGVVLNRTGARTDRSAGSNAAELARLGVPVLARMGFCRSAEQAVRRLAPLARRLISGGLRR